SHRKRAEHWLRESEVRFRALADSAPVMIRRSDPGGKRNCVNKSWRDFTGRALHDELGDGWMKGGHADDRERCRAIFAEAARARQPFVIDYRLRNAAGDYRWVVDRGAPRFLATGDFAGNIGCAVDITERTG